MAPLRRLRSAFFLCTSLCIAIDLQYTTVTLHEPPKENTQRSIIQLVSLLPLIAPSTGRIETMSTLRTSSRFCKEAVDIEGIGSGCSSGRSIPLELYRSLSRLCETSAQCLRWAQRLAHRLHIGTLEATTGDAQTEAIVVERFLDRLAIAHDLVVVAGGQRLVDRSGSR